MVTLWWWTGTQGSLASAIRLAQQHALAQPQQLRAEGVTGSLRGGGRIAQLQWQQEGLDVSATDVDLAWQALSALSGTLKLQRLAAATVVVNDQRPPSPPSAGPPEDIRLPLKLSLDAFSVGSFRLQQASRPEPLEVQALAGHYAYDGQTHQLGLANLQAFGGRFAGRALLTDRHPLQLEADVGGTLAVIVPGGTTGSMPPLQFQALAKGPLTTLTVNVTAQTGTPGLAAVTPGAQGPTTPTVASASAATNASVSATITPWALQPLAMAEAVFDRLNIGAVLPQAPQTLLSGNASVRPMTLTALATPSSATPTTANQGWGLQMQVTNALAGPLDQQRMPVDELTLKAQWQGGVATLESLRARTGGGVIQASGTWAQPPQRATPTTPTTPTTPATSTTSTISTTSSASATPTLAGPGSGTAAQAWKLQADFKDINPARLHTQLAPLPLGGMATAASRGETVDFDVDVKAAAAALPQARNNNAIAQLRLQSASAMGNWNPALAGGTVALSALNVRTDDAELAGKLEAQIAQPAGKGSITFKAPGLALDLDGDVREKSGGGTLALRIGSAAEAAAWISKLPGLPASLQNQLRWPATGNAALTAQWQGGWRDPVLQARLSAPTLDVQLPASSSAASSSTAAVAPGAPAAAKASPAAALKLRDIQADVSGRLSSAQLGLRGRAELGERRLRLQVAADAGQLAASGRDASLAASAWQGLVRQLDASLVDPAISPGAWTLGLRQPVSLRWAPPASKAGTASFEAGQGEAVLTAPTAQASSATISWQPVRWANQQLSTAGKVTGLPMTWAELIGGPQRSGSGMASSLVFDGAWDARLADTVNVKASLARSSGDLTVQAENAEGRSVRVAAGIREARVSVTSEGEALNLALVWDSERAGRADGQLATRLSRTAATPDADAGWTWAPDAPLNGQLRAQLPRIGVWSLLAPPGWRIRGSVGTNIAISGTRAAPQLSGTLQADDLALRSVVDGVEFGNGRLRATLDGTRMRIDEFSLQGAAQAGPQGTRRGTGAGGSLVAQGEAAWLNNQPSVRLSAKIDRLRGSIRTDRQLTVSGALQASLEGKLATLTGKLNVDQARLLLPEEGTPQLGTDVVVRGAVGTKAATNTTAQSGTTTTDNTMAVKVAVDIDVGEDFRVQGKGIDTELRGQLNVTADSLANPRLNGEIRTQGGKYRAYGQRLDVEQGIIRFTGQLDNPTLDILAIRPNLSQRVGVQIQGTALLPRVRLYAEPDLPDAEKLSWLVLGRSSASGGGEAALLQQAAVALLGSKGGGSGGGIAGRFGLDELSYGDASGSAGGSAVTLGKRFSDNFYAAYERSLSGAVGTLRVFYDLSQRFTVRAEAGEQSALDLIFTFQYD